jgi:hypothetical protein
VTTQDLLSAFKSLVAANKLPSLSELQDATERDSEFKDNVRYYLNTQTLKPHEINSSNSNLVTTHYRRIQKTFLNVQKICEGLEALTGSKISCNAFHSNPGTQALPAHEDLDDSFIWQATGKKFWKVWKPYHNDLSVKNLATNKNKENLEAWMKISTPLSFSLKEGEIYLLKAGHPHIAWTESDSSLHFTFLVFANSTKTDTQEY